MKRVPGAKAVARRAVAIVVAEALAETEAAVGDTAVATKAVAAAKEKAAGAAEIAIRTTTTAIPYASRANHAGKRFALTVHPKTHHNGPSRMRANDVEQNV